jgi:hypothetical protein
MHHPNGPPNGAKNTHNTGIFKTASSIETTTN